MKIRCTCCGKEYSLAEVQDEEIECCECGAPIADHYDSGIVLAHSVLITNDKRCTESEER